MTGSGAPHAQAYMHAYQRLRGRDRLLPLDDLVELNLVEAERRDVIVDDVSRFRIELVTVTGRTATVEFRVGSSVGPQAVEVFHWGRAVGRFDRRRLAEWLRTLAGEVSAGEVTLSWDTMLDSAGRVAISLSDVRSWVLGPGEVADLRDLL